MSNVFEEYNMPKFQKNLHQSLWLSLWCQLC